MIRVLHYLRHLSLGGTEKTCQLFFENASEDFQVAVAYEKSGDHPRLELFEKAAKKNNGLLIEIDSYKDHEPNPSSLQKLIDEMGVDILHVYRSGYPEFPANNVEVPHIVETNVFGFLDTTPITNLNTLFMSKWLMDNCMRRYNVISRGFLPRRFDYVNNPVEEPYTATKFSDLDKDTIWLGRCGRPDNGIYNAVNVKAANLLRLQGFNVGFIVVAPPSNMIADLEEFNIPYKAIEPTTDPYILSKFYNSVDIYAHARADGETFGVNIAEAMIHGKPVVTHIATPSVDGMGVFQSQTELVDDNVTGFIVQNDPGAYADALKRLIVDKELSRRFGYTGLIKAMKEYHVDACQHKLENIYREVVND